MKNQPMNTNRSHVVSIRINDQEQEQLAYIAYKMRCSTAKALRTIINQHHQQLNKN